MPTFGSLFTGIGGLDRGLETAGFEVRWQVERDEYCRSVLGSRWPGVRLEGDIVSVEPKDLEPVDVIAGGFPREDVSHAGRGAGIAGKRSGLWLLGGHPSRPWLEWLMGFPIGWLSMPWAAPRSPQSPSGSGDGS